MTKYYFISYVGTNSSGALVYGNCTAKIVDASLLEIGQMIQEESDFVKPATILCLKNLTEEECIMLSGKQDRN